MTDETNVISLADRRPSEVTTDEYEGGCPHCGGADEMLNVGRDHWIICHRHKTRWSPGSNLYSGWRHETEDDWVHNRAVLAGYTAVEPVYPRPDATNMKDERS